MPSNDLRRRICSIGMFIMPVVVVKLAGSLLGGPGPVNAEAATTVATDQAAAPVPAAAVKPVKWTDRQLAAASHIEELRAQSFGTSPLYYEPVTSVATEGEPVKPTPDKPAFVLNAVMSSSRGVKAVINGRPFVVGEQIRESGWIVESIDNEARSAVLKNAGDDRRMTIAVEKPM